MRRLVPAGLVPAALALIAMSGLAYAAEGVRLTPQPGVYFDAEGGGLKQPEDVAVGSAGSLLVVADTGNGRLLRYTIDGETVTAQPEIRLTQLPYPIKVAVTSGGDLIVLDGRLRRVARVSGSGAFLSYVEPSGDTASGPTTTRSIALDGSDNLYLLDIFHARVLMLDEAGGIKRQVALPRGQHSFSDITVGGTGEILRDRERREAGVRREEGGRRVRTAHRAAERGDGLSHGHRRRRTRQPVPRRPDGRRES